MLLNQTIDRDEDLHRAFSHLLHEKFANKLPSERIAENVKEVFCIK